MAVQPAKYCPPRPIRAKWKAPLYGIGHICGRLLRAKANALDEMQLGAGDWLHVLIDRNIDLEKQVVALKADNLWLEGRVAHLTKQRPRNG